jgi:uncharacterized protein
MSPSSTSASVRDLRCARCGAAFTCGQGGRDGACWCCDETYRVPMPVSATEDCLCPACLREHAKTIGIGA